MAQYKVELVFEKAGKPTDRLYVMVEATCGSQAEKIAKMQYTTATMAKSHGPQ